MSVGIELILRCSCYPREPKALGMVCQTCGDHAPTAQSEASPDGRNYHHAYHPRCTGDVCVMLLVMARRGR